MNDAQTLLKQWLTEGRAEVNPNFSIELRPLATATDPVRKLRLAYDWIVGRALATPYHDVSCGEHIRLETRGAQLQLAQDPSYASFALLPLLTLMTHRRLLIIGSPGRGKSTLAAMMGLLSGATGTEVRRAIQHGHPQLTLADLLGNPLPSDLIRAESASDIHVSWRHWIKQRVKIIDEYNRIPTKTQSALLSLMSEGYAEQFEQVIEAGPSAWFLTANDDLGGGTFPVIEALRDRIDAAVRCPPFHPQLLPLLDQRLSDPSGEEVGQWVPEDLVLCEEDFVAIADKVRGMKVGKDVMGVLGFFASQLDFCALASARLEFMSKDTLHLSGRRLAHVCNEDCPLDKLEHICTQTEAGISTRSLLAALHYARALAVFRGASEVELEDIRQMIPWILHEKIKPNQHSAFFQKPENRTLLHDKVSWILSMFDMASRQWASYATTHNRVITYQDTFVQHQAEASSLSNHDIQEAMSKIRAELECLLRQHEVSGATRDDMIFLKDLYSKYQKMLRP